MPIVNTMCPPGYRRLRKLPEPTKMSTKRITMIHSPDSVDDLKRLKMWPKMDNFWLKNIKILKLTVYDKPCGKLALGQNCIKIISDKSNSVATFLRIQTDIY